MMREFVPIVSIVIAATLLNFSIIFFRHRSASVSCSRIRTGLRLHLLLALLLLGGCDASSSIRSPQDPFEPINRLIYQFNDMLDRTVVAPTAQDYLAVVPAPARTMVRSFFSNLDDMTVALNDVLQLKLAQAMADCWRVLTNTTIGVFGLMDAASASGFEKHHEDFGQTLGYWGIGSGPYLILPFFGPSSARDGIGLFMDNNLNPLSRHHPASTRNNIYIVKIVSIRSNLLPMESMLDAQPDRYAFLRNSYLQHRQSMVYDGNPPRQKYEDEEDNSVPPTQEIKIWKR